MKKLTSSLKLLGVLTSVAILGMLFYFRVQFPGFITYGLQQAKGQMSILFDTMPIDELLNSNNLTVKEREKLLLIRDIKQFTVDSLKFSPSGSYTAFYDQHDKPLLWVVTACPPFSLKPVQWEYPFLGALEYKGFFEYELAHQEAKKLKKQGFDVSIDEVNAWSTLGYLNDPVLSSFLDLPEGRLSNLIIHELTHSHIYLPGSVTFNENFASFVGHHGAVAFIESNFGKDSKALKDYKNRRYDFALFKQHMLESSKILKDFYAKVDTTNIQQARREKLALIRSFVTALDTLPTKKPRFSHLKTRVDSLNNTFFTDFLLYNASQSEFQEEFERIDKGDIRRFIERISQTFQ